MLPSTFVGLFVIVFLIERYNTSEYFRCDSKTTLFAKEDTRVLNFTHVHVNDSRCVYLSFFKLKPCEQIGDIIIEYDLKRLRSERFGFFDSGRHRVSDRICNYLSTESISVTVEHPTSADTGIYVLRYYGVRNSTYLTICWTVFVMDIVMSSKWPILTEGSSAHFYGNPAVCSNEIQVYNLFVTWFLDGYAGNQTDRFLAKDDYMWIPRVTRDLNGKSVIYRVQYGDVVGEVSYNLNVMYIEKDSENQFVEEGTSISFHVNGIVTVSNESEALTYSWMLDGRFINENNKDRVWLPYLTRDLSQKNVTYVIRNDNGTVAELNYVLQVAYGPSWPVKLIPPNTAYYLAPGDSLPEIRCEVDCNPSCIINWGNFSNGDTLTLGRVSKTNTGEYICTATRNGSDRMVNRSVYVYVQAISDESFPMMVFVPFWILTASNTIAIVIILVCLWKFHKTFSVRAAKATATLNMNYSNLRATESKEDQTVPVPTEMYEDLQKSGTRGLKTESPYYSSLEHENSANTNTKVPLK